MEKLLSFDRAIIDQGNIRNLGNRIIVPGTLAIADQWMRYYNEDGSERWEYLPPGTLFNRDSLSTLQGAPLAVEHPGELTLENYRDAVSKGHWVGTVSTQINIDSNRNQLDVVAIISDKPTIDQILEGAITELSPSYYKQLEPHPEMSKDCFIQTARDYTGCEVSLTKAARGGENARLHLSYDSISSDPPKKYFLSTPPSTNHREPAKMATVNYDGISTEVPDQSKQIIDRAIESRDSQIATLTKEKDSAIASRDAASAEVKSLKAKVAGLEAQKVQLEKDAAEIKKKAEEEIEARDRADVIKIALPILQGANSAVTAADLAKDSNRGIKEAVIALSLDSLPAVKENRLPECADSEIQAYWEVVSSNAQPPKGQGKGNSDSGSLLERVLSHANPLDYSQDAMRKELEKDYESMMQNSWQVKAGGHN